MKRIMYFWVELKSTFWFVPVLILVFFIALAFVLIYIDSIVDLDPGRIGQYVFASSPDSARRIVSIISAAMIGVAGTVFSITLVALSLASSQFGPRLLKNYMYDRINQVVMGTYVSTFIYCLIVLNAIRGNDEFTFIPGISVFAAILAASANIILLVVFIHHIAVGIQADKVISGVHNDLTRSIRHSFRELEDKDKVRIEEVDEEKVKSSYPFKNRIIADKSGYIQLIDHDKFTDLAEELNGVIELYFRPGNFVVEKQETGILYTSKPVDKETLDKCRSFYLLGEVRTRYQDAEYSIRQMVEIASRALSPGINDPFTAISCIDKLTSAICYLTRARFPSRYRFDKDGNLRMIAKILTFEGIMDASFNQIRQYARTMPSVIVRLMESLVVIDGFAHLPNQKEAVVMHAKMVMNIAERSFQEPHDLNDLVQWFKKIG